MLRWLTAGESHGRALVAICEGVPAGVRVTTEDVAAALARRRAGWSPPPSPHLRGWPALYRDHVLQAPDGCDLDFLRAPTKEHRRFVEPVVGRS